MRTCIATLLLLTSFHPAASVAAQDAAFAPVRLRTEQLRIPIPQTVLDRQFQALSRMPGIEVEYDRFGSITRLKGHTRLFTSVAGRSVKEDEPANEIFARLSPLLAAKGTEMLVVGTALRGDRRLWRLFLRQTIRGRPVSYSGGTVVIDATSGEIVEASFTFVPDFGLPAKPKVDAAHAMRVAAEAVESPSQAAKGTVDVRPPALMYFRSPRPREPTALVWEVRTHYRPQGADPNDGDTIILVDALEGWPIQSLPAVVNILKP
jgi:hypothetical protein